MSTTELSVRNSTPAEMVRYGDGEVLKLLANRISMYFAIGERDNFGNPLSPEAREKELKAAQPALLKAAQMTYQYGLVPGIDVFIIKRGKTYSADSSLEMWKKMADRHAYLGKFRWTVDVEPLTAEQVAELTDPDVVYSEEDKGARARLFRFDVAREMKELGIPYRPLWHVGFWRKNATEKDEYVNNSKTGKKYFQADTVPNGRSRQDVAERRAIKAAIMAEFPMIAIDDFTDRYQSEERAGAYRVNAALRHLDAEIAEQGKPDGEEEGATFVETTGSYMDAAGDVWATEPTHRKPAPAAVIVVPSGTEEVKQPKTKTKAKAKKVEAEAPAPATEAPAEVAPAEETVPSGTLPWQEWQYPPQAHVWAVTSGAVADQNEAIVEWRKAVSEEFPDAGKRGITPAQATAVYERYYNNLLALKA